MVYPGSLEVRVEAIQIMKGLIDLAKEFGMLFFSPLNRNDGELLKMFKEINLA